MREIARDDTDSAVHDKYIINNKLFQNFYSLKIIQQKITFGRRNIERRIGRLRQFIVKVDIVYIDDSSFSVYVNRDEHFFKYADRHLIAIKHKWKRIIKMRKLKKR